MCRLVVLEDLFGACEGTTVGKVCALVVVEGSMSGSLGIIFSFSERPDVGGITGVWTFE